MNVSDYEASDWLGLEWSPWGSLGPGDRFISKLSTAEGLYRVRHENLEELVYIGETGRSIRGRVRALASGIFKGEMPYRDPHTASPCLWAIVDRYGPKLEISVATPPEAQDKQQRKAMEDALIALHRREQGESPTANFTRIIPGYKQSSYRKGGAVGGPLQEDEEEPHTEPGIEPPSWETPAQLTSESWMGLDWTSPEPLSEAYGLPSAAGLYRLWNPESVPPLEYVGETADLKSRLYSHRRNRAAHLRFSFVRFPELDARHKREEVESDLLGAHWLACQESPRDQY